MVEQGKTIRVKHEKLIATALARKDLAIQIYRKMTSNMEMSIFDKLSYPAHE